MTRKAGGQRSRGAMYPCGDFNAWKTRWRQRVWRSGPNRQTHMDAQSDFRSQGAPIRCFEVPWWLGCLPLASGSWGFGACVRSRDPVGAQCKVLGGTQLWSCLRERRDPNICTQVHSAHMRSRTRRRYKLYKLEGKSSGAEGAGWARMHTRSMNDAQTQSKIENHFSGEWERAHLSEGDQDKQEEQDDV